MALPAPLRTAACVLAVPLLLLAGCAGRPGPAAPPAAAPPTSPSPQPLPALDPIQAGTAFNWSTPRSFTQLALRLRFDFGARADASCAVHVEATTDAGSSWFDFEGQGGGAWWVTGGAGGWAHASAGPAGQVDASQLQGAAGVSLSRVDGTLEGPGVANATAWLDHLASAPAGTTYGDGTPAGPDSLALRVACNAPVAWGALAGTEGRLETFDTQGGVSASSWLAGTAGAADAWNRTMASPLVVAVAGAGGAAATGSFAAPGGSRGWALTPQDPYAAAQGGPGLWTVHVDAVAAQAFFVALAGLAPLAGLADVDGLADPSPP